MRQDLSPTVILELGWVHGQLFCTNNCCCEQGEKMVNRSEVILFKDLASKPVKQGILMLYHKLLLYLQNTINKTMQYSNCMWAVNGNKALYWSCLSCILHWEDLLQISSIYSYIYGLHCTIRLGLNS